MRQFSNIEKQLIQVLLQEGKQISNLICTYLDNETILVSRAAENKITLLIDQRKYPEQEQIIKRAYTITEKVVIIVNLLKYLESHSLITFFIPTFGVPFAGHITKSNELLDAYKSAKENFSEWWYTDKTTERYLLEKIGFVIHPSEELKVHVNNIYVTQEIKRHKQLMTATWVAIVISIILGFWGICQNIKNSSQEIKLNEMQKKELIDAIKNR